MIRRLAVAVILLMATPSMHATSMGLWAGPPESICNLPEADDGQDQRISLLWLGLAHSLRLWDPNCPERALYVRDVSAIGDFIRLVDPAGARFGIPPGAGTYNTIELSGRIVKGNERFLIGQVVSYERHDVLDAGWRKTSSEWGRGQEVKMFEARIPPLLQPRSVSGLGVYTVVVGDITDAEVGTLMKTVKTASADVCRINKFTNRFVVMDCHWSHPTWGDMRTWTFEQAGKTWRLLKKSDAAHI